MANPKALYLVGITGGIGAGKSTIAKIFEVLGRPLYYADSRASWLMDNDRGLQDLLRDEFGSEVIIDRKANKEFLRETVFSDSDARRKLNSLVHPVVQKDFEKWQDDNQGEPYLVKEAALLIESGSYKNLDVLIGVFAGKEKRMERILERDSYRKPEDVEKIMTSQMSEKEMRPFCHIQIENNGTEPVLEEILILDSSLRNRNNEKIELP
jgi:dephospho-CoA kinase